MKQKSIKTNALLNTINSLLGIVFPLISFPYVSRVLGVDNMGIYNFSSSIVSYFLLIAGLGINTYAIREGAQYRDNKIKMQRLTSEIFSINVFSTCLSYFLLMLTLLLVPKLASYKIPILILSGEIIFTTLGLNWCCNVYEDFLFNTVRSIITHIASLLLLFLFVKTTNDLIMYCFIVVFANAGSNIINFFYIRKKYVRFKLTVHIELKKHIKPILILFLSAVAITIYVSSDTTMIGFMLGDTQVGLYGTAVKIYTIVKNILLAILIVLIPRFSILLNVDKVQAEKLFSKVFNTLNIMILPAMVGLFIMSKEIVGCFAGIDYIGASNSLKILSIATVFSLYASLWIQCILIPMKKESIFLKSTIVSAIVNIVLNFIMIPLLGIDGAAITTVIAECIVFLYSYRYSHGDIQLKNIKKNFLSVVLGCIVIVGICLFIRMIISNIFIRLFVSVGSSAIVYFLVLVIAKNDIVLTEFKKIIRKIFVRRRA